MPLRIIFTLVLFAVIGPWIVHGEETGRCEEDLKTKRTPYRILQMNSVPAAELISQEFYSPSDRGAVVGIDGYAGTFADHNRAHADFLIGKPFSDSRKVFTFETKDAYAFLRQLKYVYARSGPIYRLAIMGHGGPGWFNLGEEKIDAAWARRNWETLAELPRDLFAPEAEIVLLSCECAMGSGGDRLIEIFSRIAHQGATVFASRKIVLGNLDGFEDTPESLAAKKLQSEREAQPGYHTKMLPLVVLSAAVTVGQNIWRMFTLDHESKYGKAVIALPIQTKSLSSLGDHDYVRKFRCADEAVRSLYYAQRICTDPEFTFTITRKGARIHIDAGERGEFDFDKMEDTILAGRMGVEKDFKGNGIGTALFEMAQTVHPAANRFAVSTLAEDNRIVVEDALAEGKSVEEAIRLSPAFRIAKRFGFFRIESIDTSPRPYGKGPKYGFVAVRNVSKRD